MRDDAEHPDLQALLADAQRWWTSSRSHHDRAAGELAAHGSAAAAALDRRLADAVAGLWARGWNPAALLHVVGRTLSARHARLAARVALAQAQQQRAAGLAMDGRWAAELDDLAATAGRVDAAAEGALRADAPEELMRAVTLWCALGALPAVPQTIPPPGSSPPPERGQPAPPTATDEALDGRVLTRVRALLAKAESTAFSHEAEALTAKAQQLLARHAIDAALVTADAGDTTGRRAALRRVLLHDPYVAAKAQIVGAVASTNGCAAVSTRDLGWVTVAGDARDLDAVELLSTSLLAQATAALGRQGGRRDGTGRSRTKAFRRAFLLGFATRIHERLEAAERAEARAASAEDARVLPVLRQRQDRAEETLAATFPDAVRRRLHVGHDGGWLQGSAAADAASLRTPAGRLPGR